MTIQISVVVPTYRRPELLQRCLAALLAQHFDPAAYEIIVADDAACQETKQWVEACVAAVWQEAERPKRAVIPAVAYPAEALVYAAPGGLNPAMNPFAGQSLATDNDESFPGRNGGEKHGRNGQPARPLVHYVPVTGNHGPAAARNQGWQAACGEIIAFTDDDCIPAPNWLRAGLAAFRPGVAAASGRIIVPLPDTPTDYERDAAELEKSEFATANCFYRRSVLAAVGGFDEHFRIAWREDSDLFFRVMDQMGDLEQATRLVRVPQAIVVHPIRPATWGISLKQQRKSMFNALLYKKHPRRYWERVQPGPPWRYYTTMLALLLAVSGSLASQTWPALGAALVWLLLTGYFCVRRLSHTTRTPAHIAEMIVTSALIPPLSIFWRLRGALKFRVIFF